MSKEIRDHINYDSNHFGWRNIHRHTQYIPSLRKYSFKDNADLTIELLRKVKEKTGKEKIKVLDFGCGEGTVCLKEPKPFIEYAGYDNDLQNDFATYHSLDEMEECHFDVIVFSHVIAYLQVDEMISVMEWSLDHGDYIIVILQRAEYPFNEFFAPHHIKAWDNEMFLGYLDIIGWETINYYHVDWRSKSDPFLIAIPRFIFCVLMWISPFMGFLVFARNKKTTPKWR